TPTRLPSVASATMARAPTYVFPDPGGPWIGSTPSSSSRQSRTVASTRGSPARRSGAPILERRRGGRRHRRSEAARYGPSASRPAVATWSAKASSESSSAPAEVLPPGALLLATEVAEHLRQQPSRLLGAVACARVLRHADEQRLRRFPDAPVALSDRFLGLGTRRLRTGDRYRRLAATRLE